MRGGTAIWLAIIAMSFSLTAAIMQRSVLLACTSGAVLLAGVIMLVRGRRDPLRNRRSG